LLPLGWPTAMEGPPPMVEISGNAADDRTDLPAVVTHLGRKRLPWSRHATYIAPT
jgi:hypothetical protein